MRSRRDLFGWILITALTLLALADAYYLKHGHEVILMLTAIYAVLVKIHIAIEDARKDRRHA